MPGSVAGPDHIGGTRPRAQNPRHSGAERNHHINRSVGAVDAPRHAGDDPGCPQQPIARVGERRFGGGTICSTRLFRPSRATRLRRMEASDVLLFTEFDSAGSTMEISDWDSTRGGASNRGPSGKNLTLETGFRGRLSTHCGPSAAPAAMSAHAPKQSEGAASRIEPPDALVIIRCPSIDRRRCAKSRPRCSPSGSEATNAVASRQTFRAKRLGITQRVGANQKRVQIVVLHGAGCGAPRLRSCPNLTQLTSSVREVHLAVPPILHHSIKT